MRSTQFLINIIIDKRLSLHLKIPCPHPGLPQTVHANPSCRISTGGPRPFAALLRRRGPCVEADDMGVARHMQCWNLANRRPAFLHSFQHTLPKYIRVKITKPWTWKTLRHGLLSSISHATKAARVRLTSSIGRFTASNTIRMASS